MQARSATDQQVVSVVVAELDHMHRLTDIQVGRCGDPRLPAHCWQLGLCFALEADYLHPANFAIHSLRTTPTCRMSYSKGYQKGHSPKGWDSTSTANNKDPTLDPKVPTWSGEGEAIGLELFAIRAKGYRAGLEDTKKKLAGARLWQNLRGTPQKFLNKTNPETFAVDDGVEKLITLLQTRYPEGPLRKLPRIYRKLFRDIHYTKGQDIANLFTDLERAKEEVEENDKSTKVSTCLLYTSPSPRD